MGRYENGERWYSFAAFCKKEFGRRLYRVALNGNMTCPNRDGTLGRGGCIFCGEGGSGDFAIPYEGRPMSREDFVWMHHQNAREGDFIAYFQSYSNTYGPIEKLKLLFEGALEDSVFAGIDIATRPDCLGEPVLLLLKELKEKYPDKFIWVELGLQTIHEDTARWISRGYDLKVFDEGMRNLNALGIPVIVHLIAGLPGENEERFLESVRYMNTVGAFGVKLHLLHILRGTRLCELYEKEPEKVHVLTKEEYVRRIALALGNLDPGIVIHRLTGDGPSESLVAPLWSVDKKTVINEIRSYMSAQKFEQGSLTSRPK